MTAQAGDTPDSKSALRRLVRAQRASLTPTQRQRAADAAALRLLRAPRFRHARRVAVYLAHGSELSTAPLIDLCHALRKQVFVPRAGRDGRMRFVRLDSGTRLRRGALGIDEPAGHAPAVPVRALDVIVLPLVAFDAAGLRLGTGGGYYDRALAASRGRAQPWRVGYAYALQQVAAVPREPWDIPLDAIVTERALIRPAARAP